MKKNIRCKKELFEELIISYDSLVASEFGGSWLKALENFEVLAERKLRVLVRKFYPKSRSGDQAWRSCKGKLYEYAVFRYIKEEIEKDGQLRETFELEWGEEIIENYSLQVAISNWTEIFPDLDLALIDKNSKKVKVILSCKTSLRERVTESAFWRRELERKGLDDIKFVFITTDKDNELKNDTNRYILLHVLDCTFITDPKRYEGLLRIYQNRFGQKSDFGKLLLKVRPICEVTNFLRESLS